MVHWKGYMVETDLKIPKLNLESFNTNTSLLMKRLQQTILRLPKLNNCFVAIPSPKDVLSPNYDSPR